VELGAASGVTVSIVPRDGRVDAVVQWLAIEPLREPRYVIDGRPQDLAAPLKPLEANEALVGLVGVDAAAAATVMASLFPGGSIITFPLTDTPPTPGAWTAWEALDAIVFDRAPAARDVAELLAGGVTVVVRGEAKPDESWPWEQRGEWWVVSPLRAGPQGAVVPATDDAIAGWNPGWPAPVRRQVVLLGCVFCLLALGASLWRSRMAVGVVVLLSAAAAAGLWWWGTRRPPAPWGQGAVVVTDGRLSQEDQWVFTRALSAGRFSTASIGRPVFASGEQFAAADVRLKCDASGRPVVLSWHANAGEATAQLFRSVTPAAPLLSTTKAGPSPLRELARQSYLSDGAALQGELPSAADPDPSGWREDWPGILVRLPRP